MRIFNSETGDPMLLDKEAGLRALASELAAFLASRSIAHSFPALTSGDPEPHSEFLGGLRIEKAERATPELNISDDRWLELKASVAELQKLRQTFDILRNGDHAHLYASPISLIVEADDTWPGSYED